SFVSYNPSLAESLLILADWFHIATPSVHHKNSKAWFNPRDIFGSLSVGWFAIDQP
ncbi:hypothetical protein JOQ06_030193, partial [Pogonophryne albipinna]